jgi:hypothetical protein
VAERKKIENLTGDEVLDLTVRLMVNLGALAIMSGLAAMLVAIALTAD